MKRIIMVCTLILLLTGCSNKEQKIVNVLNWSSYIPGEIIEDFEDETGIKVHYSTYSSNEELLAKINGAKEGTYDLIFPSDYMVDVMKKREMLDKIDSSKLENFKNINPTFLNNDYDVGNEYTLPFLLATTIITYNTKYVKENITSYNDLLNEKYKNSIVLLDDERIIVGMGLLASGYSMNSTNENELEEAYEWLDKLKPNIKAYDSDSPKNFLITEEAYIGVIWSAESVLASMNKDGLKSVFPSEGIALSLDNFALPKNSSNRENAYKFIDYLLRGDVMKKIIESYPYKSVNMETDKLLPEEYMDNIAFNIPDNVFYNGSFVKNIGDSIKLYDNVWIKIK